MYFQIENTPEDVRRNRNKQLKESNVEEVTCLTLAPFCAVPKIYFENVPVGVESRQQIDIVNPSVNTLQLHFIKPPPSDVGLKLSWTETVVEGNETKLLELVWFPEKAIGQQITLQLGDQRKGRYDVKVFLKSVTKSGIAGKLAAKKKPSGFSSNLNLKKSPKISKAKYTVSPKNRTQKELRKYSNSFDIDFKLNQDESITLKKSPLKSLDISHFNQQREWVTDHHVSDIRRETYMISNSYDCDKENGGHFLTTPTPQRMVKLNKNKHNVATPMSVLSAIDNLEFTPTKPSKHSEELPSKKPQNDPFSIDDLAFTPLRSCNKENIQKNTKANSKTIESLYDFVSEEKIQFVTINNHYTVEEKSSLMEIQNHKFSMPQMRVQKNSENVMKRNNKVNHNLINKTHDIIDLDASTANRPDLSQSIQFVCEIPSIEVNEEEDKMFAFKDYTEFTPVYKNISALNDSIEFNPKRCSTERKQSTDPNVKENQQVCRDLFQTFSPNNLTYDAQNATYGRLSSETYTKADSPIIPIDPANHDRLQSSPYSTVELSPLNRMPVFNPPQFNCPRKLAFNENVKSYNERADMRNSIKEKNMRTGVQGIIEANLWQKGASPRAVSPTQLASIPEESTMLCENSVQDYTKKVPQETFVMDRTYDKLNKTNESVSHNQRGKWTKTYNASELRSVKHFSESTICREIIKSESHIVCDQVVEESRHFLDIKSIATTIDPFLASTCLYDERAYDELEKEFKMWLNYLLTPHADLDTNLDGSRVDIGKAWIENRNKAIPAAPTREQVSSQYHTSHRLDSLRKTAEAFIKNPQISEVFLKVTNQVDRKILTIRTDKDIHLDIGLQKIILGLLLCYNPLWLRIGLETLYGKKIPLTSNNDFMGLSDFIIQRMFKDPYIGSKHSNPAVPNVHLPSYSQTIKKFTLKKFLFLVYFLDQAKNIKMIPHDPCLFCRNAPYKESREILIQFAKEVLSGVGDITKHLRHTGYVVSHKQTYLNEFKYAVHNLAVDLKDGVRLTRLMEIILLKENLISGLRTPAISRLQKIHNASIALTALESAGFNIVGDIKPKDIVDGHREKTLSLLWQMINKFRLPLFDNAALVIQKWWRRNYLRIWVRNRIQHKKQMLLYNSATKIQSWWKTVMCRRSYLIRLKTEKPACIIIQKYWRMWMCKKRFQIIKSSAITIQKWYRRVMPIYQANKQLKQEKTYVAARKIQIWYRRLKRQQNIDQCVERKNFLAVRKSVLCIQTLFRAHLEMKKVRRVFVIMKISTIKIQRYYRRVLVQRATRREFLELRYSTILIQRRFRANVAMNECKTRYDEIKKSAVCIQNFYRNYRMAKETRENYKLLKSAVLYIQEKYRGKQQMKVLRDNFYQKRISAIKIQNYYRSYCEMKTVRENYLKQMKSAILIQKWFRAHKAMKLQRDSYLRLKRACVCIQRQYRANRLMVIQRQSYVTLKQAAICIQRKYKALLVMRTVRQQYIKYRNAVLTVQRQYRAQKEMKKCKIEYHLVRSSTIKIQTWYRSIILMRKTRSEYAIVRDSVLKMQNRFRANVLARKCRRDYEKLRCACVTIQRHYRSHMLMQDALLEFSVMKSAAITIQVQYRAYLKMKQAKEKYVKLKEATIKVQNYYRNVCLMREVRRYYLSLKGVTVSMQQRYRANQSMKSERQLYLLKRNSAIVIQNYYRSYCKMVVARKAYVVQRDAIITIQRRFRAHLEMKKQRSDYQRMQTACVCIQKHFKGYLLMKRKQNEFKKFKSATLIIQRRYRAMIEMKKCRNDYQKIRDAIVKIQTVYRAYKLMLQCRNEYNVKRNVIVKMQLWYRSIIAMREDRKYYESLKLSTIKIQQRFRGKLLMRKHRSDYLKYKHCCVIVQNRFRSKMLTRQCSADYNRIRSSAIVVQRRYRAMIQMRIARKRFLELKVAAIVIQHVYRNNKLTSVIRKQYCTLKYTTIRIQRIVRSKIIMRKCRQQFLEQKISASLIQRYFRSYIAMKREREYFIRLKENVLVVQNIYRGKLLTREIRMSYLLKKSAAVKIQSTFRLYRQRKQFLNLKHAAVILQRHWRDLQMTRKIRKDYLIIKNNVIKIQAMVKRILARRKYVKIVRSVTLIQRAFRLKVKMEQERMQLSLRNSAALKIQTCWRSFIVRRQYLLLKRSVVVCQRRRRALLLMREERNDYMMLRTSVIRVQTIISRWLSRRALSRTLEERRAIRVNKAALKIQSFWRGYCIRKRQAEDCRVARLRRRWQEGALESDQQTLAERNRDALVVLGHFRDIASVISAFKTLDFVTNVYPMMYGTEDTAVPLITRLLVYMGAANRSVSTLETLQLGIAVLVNLTKYEPTAHFVYNDNTMKTVLTLMLRWCDKDVLLSRLFCTLLWVMGKYEDIRKDLCKFLSTGEPYKTLCKVRFLLIRKRRMDSKRRSIQPTLSSANSCGPSLGDSRHSLTPVKPGRVLTCNLPSTEPDYSIQRTSQPKIFADEIQAIDAVFFKFNLTFNIIPDN